MLDSTLELIKQHGHEDIILRIFKKMLLSWIFVAATLKIASLKIYIFFKCPLNFLSYSITQNSNINCLWGNNKCLLLKATKWRRRKTTRTSIICLVLMCWIMYYRILHYYYTQLSLWHILCNNNCCSVWVKFVKTMIFNIKILKNKQSRPLLISYYVCRFKRRTRFVSTEHSAVIVRNRKHWLTFE